MTDRQTDRQTNRLTDRQRQTGRQIDRETDRERERERTNSELTSVEHFTKWCLDIDRARHTSTCFVITATRLTAFKKCF